MTRHLLNSLWFRLLLGFAVPLILFLGAAFVSFVSIHRLLDSLKREQTSQEVLTKIFEANENLEAMAAAKRAHHLLGREEFEKDFYRRRAIFQKDVDELEVLFQENPKQLDRLARIRAKEENWHQLSKDSFQMWHKRPKVLGIEFFKEFEKLNLEEGVKLLKDIRVLTDKMTATEYEMLGRHREEVQLRTRESIWAIVAALIVSIGFSIVITQMLWRGISRPVEHLRSAVHAMRQGRYEAVSPYGPSEIVELMRGFNLMGLALSERTTLLESSELRYRTVVGTTANLIWTTDAAGENTEMANWCAFTGQKSDEVQGEGWLNAVHPDDCDRFRRNWRTALKNKVYLEEEVRIRRASGEYGDFLCRSVPIFDPCGEVVEWMRICADITERKREETLRREKEAAEAANRAKSEFLTKMSHELRTPLNAIIGMSKMLRTQRFGELNDKQLDYLADVTQAGEHLLFLINDILDLSRVETGRMELKPEPLPLGETIEQAASTVSALADSKSLTLHTQLPEPDGLITADVARFKQILYNLISNAVKFTPAGGRVSVRCNWVAVPSPEAPVTPRKQAQAIRIDVEDTGIGIASEDQAKLGTEFFQARSSPHKAQEGTGLGLALSRRLAEMMGGQLWFTSELGQGSTFSFALPIQSPAFPISTPPPAPAEDHKPMTLDTPAHRALVLVIDDHLPTNKLLGDWLEEAGLHAISAYDGQAGLQQARCLKPRLILLDMRLPDSSGLEVLHQLKGDPETADIPVVVISVMEGQQQMQELDVLDWFVKPLDKDRLIRKLQETLPGLFHPERTVLLVEDDARARKWLRDMLFAEGLQVREAENGAQALEFMKAETPDLVLLDLLMPEMNGFQMVQTIRANPDWEFIPIMIITGKDITPEDRDRLGDYIQAIFRKDNFTREKLLDRMNRLGLNVASPKEIHDGA